MAVDMGGIGAKEAFIQGVMTRLPGFGSLALEHGKALLGVHCIAWRFFLVLAFTLKREKAYSV